MTPDRQHVRARRRFALLLALAGLSAALATWWARNGPLLEPAAVKELAASWGSLAPLIYVGVFAVRPFLFFPAVVLFVGGGLVFGALWGTIYAAIGVTIGGLVTFALARLLGRDFVQASLRARRRALATVRWGPGLVFALNLIPVFPITVINTSAGLSQMSVGPFALALVAGSTPRAFAYSFFGSRLVDAGVRELGAALGLIVGLLVVGLILRRTLGLGDEPGAG